MQPGETTTIEEYKVTYTVPRMEVDQEKRMIFADLEVTRAGKPVERLSPAKFIYKATPDQPSTEVARHVSPKNDLYVIIGMVNPQTRTASFQFHINPLVSFIWFGVGILIFGAIISMWPDVGLEEQGAFGYIRAGAAVATSVMFAVLLALGPSMAYGRGARPDAHAGAAPDAAVTFPTSGPATE